MSGVEVGLHYGQKHATKLGSHANMIVLGMHCLLINDLGTTAHVNSFSKEAGSISEVLIVGGVCIYDCPQTGQLVPWRVGRELR